MSETDFWDNEMWMAFNRMEGYRQKEKKDWQLFSWLGTLVVSPYVKKGQQNTPDKLAPWAWDEAKEQKRPLSAEEKRKLFAEADERVKRAYERKLKKRQNG
jgi:hypothetical protein